MFANIGMRYLKRRQLFVFALFFGLCGPGLTRAQSWRWTIEDLDDKNPQQTSIVADKDGNVHLAYYLPEGFGELRYAFRSAGDSRWFKMTLDEHLGVFSTGIGLDSNDNPSICYTPREMKYIHWNGQKWSSQQVDPNSGLIAYHCSIQFAQHDVPHITWYLESVFVLRHAALEDGTWKVRSVEVGMESGKWNSLVLDKNNLPHVAYSSFAKDELKYAHFDGRDWARTVIDTSEGNPQPGARGMGASLVLDPEGNPRISYYDVNSLKYARLIAGKWKIEVIEQLPPFVVWSWKNFQSTQLLDRDGNPHISYESYLGLKHAWWDGKQWHTQLIRPYIDGFFFESCMTMDSQGNLYISLKDPFDGTLKVAIGTRTQPLDAAKAGSKNSSN